MIHVKKKKYNIRVTLGLGYIGIMEEKMETTITWGYFGVPKVSGLSCCLGTLIKLLSFTVYPECAKLSPLPYTFSPKP